MARVFISYRRADTADMSRRIYDQLAKHVGETNVFRDVDTLDGTEHYVIVSDVMLVLIGDKWLNLKDEKTGGRRLDSPKDFVRTEIDMGLRYVKRVIPVLVNGAGMPSPTELPLRLADLAYRDAITISDATFEKDIAELLYIVVPPAHRIFLWATGGLVKLKYTWQFVVAVIAAIISGVILTYLIQDAHFVIAPPTNAPATNAASMATKTPTSTPRPDGTVVALQATLDYWGTLAPTIDVFPNVENIAGNANVYPFYDDTVNSQDTTIVELQIILYELAVTPTPFGEVTLIPANASIDRPEVVQNSTPQITPRPARLEGTIEGLPPHIIADLECSETIFSGCGQQPVRDIQLQGINEWVWRIQPIIERASKQSLSIVLYAANETGEKQSNTPIWRHNFEMIIGDSSTFWEIIKQNVGTIIGGLFAVLVALISGGYLINRSRNEKTKILRPNAPRVFVSYRRAVSAGFANTLHDRLEKRGASVFIDVDDIHAGSFSDYIKENIMKSDHFIVILAPETLTSDWVVKEIQYAHEHKKTIIPVLVNDFDLYGSEVTAGLEFLQNQNAVKLLPEYVDAAVEKIAEFIGLENERR